jgi:hypothetical protein
MKNMKRFQIKYCYSEEEANEFLKTITVDDLKYPRLHSDQYYPRVSGDGVETEKANEDGITAQAKVNSDLIAVIQYFDVFEE